MGAVDAWAPAVIAVVFLVSASAGGAMLAWFIERTIWIAVLAGFGITGVGVFIAKLLLSQGD